jgi:hypothetical protein
MIMDRIARALRAAGTARLLATDPAPGTAAVIAPALRMPFVVDATRKTLLRQWARDLLSEGDDLGQSLLAIVEEEDPADSPDSISARLLRELGDQSIVDALTPTQQLKLIGRLDTLTASATTENPQVRRILENLRGRLEVNADYRGEARAAFDVVLVHTLRFLADRMNIQLSAARVAYLTDPGALEGALQEDYREWMVGNGLQGIVDIEVRDTAAGRVDVRFAFGADRIVTEVKRDEDPFADGALAKYLNQAGAYQVSNVRLGILLVLDLSDKTKGQARSLERSVWLATKPALAPGDLERPSSSSSCPATAPGPPRS